MNEQKVNNYINSFISDDETHPEVRRFLEDFSIKIEFGHFEDDLGENDEFEDPYA